MQWICSPDCPLQLRLAQVTCMKPGNPERMNRETEPERFPEPGHFPDRETHETLLLVVFPISALWPNDGGM